MEYGIQMYSIRDLTGEDLDGALKAVSEMGYKTVEFAGFFGHSAEEVKAMLDKYNLKVIGTHSGIDELVNNFEDTVKYHKILGNKRYIIPGADTGTREALDRFISQVNKYQPMLEAEGIQMGYHNHAHEFKPEEYGYHIHEELQQKTNLFFEIDTYWAFVARQNPIELLEKLKKMGRIKMIHLKDGDEEGNGVSLGSGKAPVAAVRKKAIELGLDIVVESEGLNPTGTEETKRCIDYLRTLD